MDNPNIEIHAARALRVDAAGRIGRLRVIGVADQADQQIRVEACIAQLGEPDGPSWRDQDAHAIARTVDPARTFVGYHKQEFAHDLFMSERRQAHLWVAEIDLLGSLALPPIVIGRQPVAVNVRARYVFGDEAEALRTFDEIEPTEEFDIGVLFVHGIGRQRRAETLAEWSAPLLRWINAWLSGATDEIASKLPEKLVQGSDETATKRLHETLEGWFNSLVVRENMSQIDLDYADRAAYAKELVRKALAPMQKKWQDELRATIRQTTAATEQRCMTAEEKSDADKVIGAIKGIKASAVGGSAEFRDAYILDVGTHSVDPSSVEMHVEAMASDGYMLRSRWMLAESHWAETFWGPSFFRFGRWCLLTAPILLVHYIAMARLRHPTWLRWIFGVFGLAIAVTLAQLAFMLLTVLWLVPWQRLRAGVLRVQLELAGVVGDSYVLLEDPVQRRAILDRVHRNLEWLVQRCRSVVLIAHSQGAAVAELVLSQREEAGSGKIQALATLGAGVQTLTTIGDLAESRGAKTAGWAAIGCVLLLGGAVVIAMMGAAPLALLLAVVAVVGLILAAQRAWVVHPGRRVMLPRAAWLRPWFDFFARRDLVPYGPVVDPEHNGETYNPKEVRNRDSYAADHVTYWENAEQVVGPLARLIGSAAGFKPLAELLPDDDATFARLERSRLSRLSFLHAARFVMLLATVMLLYANWDAWFAIGFWAIVWVQSKLGFAIGSLRVPTLEVWLQALVVFVPFVVHKSVINAIFDGWTSAEVERLLRRSAGKPATHWAAMFTTLLVTVLAGTIAFSWQLVSQLGAPLVGGATIVAVIVFAWIACKVHAKRTDAHDAGTGLVAAKEAT